MTHGPVSDRDDNQQPSAGARGPARGNDADTDDVQPVSRAQPQDDGDAYEIPSSPYSDDEEQANQRDSAATDDNPEQQLNGRNGRWWQRKSVHVLVREYQHGWLARDRWDDRDNEESRLPSDETVHLGGLTLVEAFTPSTVARLYASLKRWQDRNPYGHKDWATELEQRRSSAGGGWSSLGMVRPPGSFTMGMGFTDPDLPAGVDAVWLSVSYVTPSVAIVSATFTIGEDAGDLSEVLRRDRRRIVEDVRLIIPGRLGKYRARIPWVRPVSHGMTSSLIDAWTQKERDVEALATRFEAECGSWFYSKFRGRFAELDPTDRPRVRLVFTEKTTPFQGKARGPLAAVGLGQSWHPFTGSEPASAGWWLSTEGPRRSGRERLWIFAARRSDAGEHGKFDSRGTSNWSLTQAFSSDQVQLVAIHALWVLLDVFSVELARLRDRARRGSGITRPVRDASELSSFLLTDGLDAATVAPELASLASDISRFRWGVPEYDEHLEPTPLGKDRERVALIPRLGQILVTKATELGTGISETAGNLRASAELQQAIASTRMQRAVLVLTVLAVAIAVASLFFTSQPISSSPP